MDKGVTQLGKTDEVGRSFTSHFDSTLPRSMIPVRDTPLQDVQLYGL